MLYEVITVHLLGRVINIIGLIDINIINKIDFQFKFALRRSVVVITSYSIHYTKLYDESGETGNPNADWVLSYNGKIEWRGISLGLLAEWKQGGDMWNARNNFV